MISINVKPAADRSLCECMRCFIQMNPWLMAAARADCGRVWDDTVTRVRIADLLHDNRKFIAL
jgi:hypothetical protein